MDALLTATVFVMNILLIIVSRKCREMSKRVDRLEQRVIDLQLEMRQ